MTIRSQAPTAADLAVADELDRLAEHVQTLPPDDYRDDIKRICHNRAKDLRRGVKRAPTSEQVLRRGGSFEEVFTATDIEKAAAWEAAQRG